MSRRAAAALLAAGWLAAGCFAHDYRSRPRLAIAGGDPIVQMASPGKFASLIAPRLVPLAAHPDPPFPDEKVVGVDLGGTPRMYPLGLLDSYEVVNDEAAGVPYVVTRCALTDIAAVYDRRVAGRTLTFENSGALWRDTLVLRDRETGTYWTPATGRALSGALEGETLAGVPAAISTARAWKESLPDSLCLDTGELTAVPLVLQLYGASPWQGVSGTRTVDRRYRPKKRLFFVHEANEAFAFTADEIRNLRRHQTTLGGRPLTVEWDGALRVPRAFTADATVRMERPVISIFWFALARHFGDRVSTPAPGVTRGN